MERFRGAKKYRPNLKMLRKGLLRALKRNPASYDHFVAPLNPFLASQIMTRSRNPQENQIQMTGQGIQGGARFDALNAPEAGLG